MGTAIRTPSTAALLAKTPRVEGETKTAGKVNPELETLQREQALQGDQGDQGGLPPNGTFSLWQMLLAIMKYEKTVLNNNAEMQKDWAQNLGGANGIYAKLYHVGCSVGAEEAEGLRDDAYSKFAQMGVTLGSLVASGYQYRMNTRPQINAGEASLKDASAMETAMKNSQAGIRIGEKEEGPLTEADQAGVDARLNGWEDGSRSVENFNGVAQENGISAAEDARLNKLAAEHAANDQTKYGKIMKRVNEAKTSAQNRISQADTNFNSRQQMNQTLTGALTNAAAAGGSLAQADAATYKAQANAAQSIISQVQQAIVAMLNKAEQNAQDALSQANQWAQGFASAAASQVHG